MNCVTYDFINKYFYCLSSSTFKTDTKKNQQEELGIINLEPIDKLMTTSETEKTVTLDTTFHKHSEEANNYVQFEYGPQTIF